MLMSGAALGLTAPAQFVTQAANAKIAAAKASKQRKFGQNPLLVKPYNDVGYQGSARGLMVEKGLESFEEQLLIFQFNPESIDDVKQVNFETKSYLGFNHNNYIWSNGGERVLSFHLNFEATASFNTPHFGFTVMYGNDGYDTLENEGVFPRGTLDYVEKLTSYQYPKQPDPLSPRFSNGGHVPTPKFMPPPIVVFAHGNYYFEGIVADVQVKHTLFNNKLIPVRSECDVQFKVLEQVSVQVNKALTQTSRKSIPITRQRIPR